jgi:hypothetical protein
VDGSVVGFSLTSWGGAGFQYFVGPDAGEAIVNADLNLCFGNEPNRYATASIARYSNRPQSIQIRSAAAVGIPGAETLRYQKVTIKARNIRAYSQNGVTYRSDRNPPPPAAPRGFRSFSTDPKGANYRRLSEQRFKTASVVGAVPGGSIMPAIPTPGPPSGQQFGSPISNLVTDDWSQALGEVVVYFFVFPTWQMANTVIHGINGNPNEQVLI